MRKIFVHKITYTIVLQKAHTELKRVFLTRSTFSSVFVSFFIWQLISDVKKILSESLNSD